MQLYVIRHAQPDDEADTGGDGDPDLSELGRRQADSICNFLRHEQIDHIVSSPMLRAHQTGTPLANELGLDVELDDDLKEAGWQLGAYMRLEENFDRMVTKISEDPDYLFAPEGREVFTDRVVASFGRIAAANSGRRVAVFCHGMVTASLIGWVLGVAPTTDMFQPRYSALTRIEASPGRDLWSVRSFNESMHLSPGSVSPA